MHRTHVFTMVTSIAVLHVWTVRGDGQNVQLPTAGNASQTQANIPYPPPVASSPSTSYPLGGYAAPAPIPPPVQDQAVQNLVGDAQRFGLPFDPYVQPTQYVAPGPPPAVVLPPGPVAPLMPFPSIYTYWGGCYGGFEATILEARAGSTTVLLSNDFPVDPPDPLDEVELPISSFDFHTDYDLEFSPRVWLGYKGCSGLGVRLRWWYYDHSGAGEFEFNGLTEGEEIFLPNEGEDVIVDVDSTLRTDLRVNSIDLEGTQDGQFHNWDFQIAGGVRYAKIDYDQVAEIEGEVDYVLEPPDDFEFEETISAISEFEGVGPTIALAGRRPLFFVDGLAFLVNLRLAFLFGETDAELLAEEAFDEPVDVAFQEHMVQVWEAQVGFEYSRQLRNSARLFVGAFLEAQVWEWSTPLGVSSSDLAFFGPTAAVGLAR
jgi:hypothetical protein